MVGRNGRGGRAAASKKCGGWSFEQPAMAVLCIRVDRGRPGDGYLMSVRCDWKQDLVRVPMVAVILLGVSGAVRQVAAQQLKVGPVPPTPAQVGPMPLTPQQVVNAMIANEDDDPSHRDRYEFVSNERSERTGEHLWTERVVETAQGRIRFLLAV